MACWGHSSREMKLSFAQHLLNYCAHHALMHAWAVLIAERQIMLSSTTCLITANFCWNIPPILSIDFSLEARQRTTPTFDTATDVTTDLVNDECVVTDGSMLYSLPRFCLVHTIDSCENEGQFSCDRMIIWMCFLCLLAKQHSAFKWKDAIFGFLFPPQVVQKH